MLHYRLDADVDFALLLVLGLVWSYPAHESFPYPEAVAVSLHIEKQSFHKGYISMITI